MITLFLKNNGSIVTSMISATDPIPPGVVWIDLLMPTLEEEKSVEKQLGIEIPSREEVWKNETLHRFYEENGVSYMTAAVITKIDTPYPQTSAVTFILSPNYLITMRYISPRSFLNFTQRIQRQPQKFPTTNHILEGLLEEMITRVAYNAEIVVNELDRLSHDIFGHQTFENTGQNTSQIMKAVLRHLGTCADLNSKITESLHSLSRVLSYFKEVHCNSKDVNVKARTLMGDVDALIRQANFMSDKLTFQLDATLGMINVEQNMIIKIFSVVAVFFLPPTLVSSVYGMNFHNMPELNWQYGYAAALFLMAMCAVGPYLYFRKKGWL